MTQNPGNASQRSRRARSRRAVSVVLLAWVLGSLSASGIDYEPSSLGRMLGRADLVVQGEVVELGEETVVATVEQALGDRATEEARIERIEIVRYELYDDPGGLARYEPGQVFVWMLSWRGEPGIVGSEPRWHVFGAEGEGELPVADGFVHLRQELLESKAGEERSLHGRQGLFVRTPLETFWDAATGYRRCVEWEPVEEAHTPRARIVCPESEWSAFAARSPLHHQLAHRLQHPE